MSIDDDYYEIRDFIENSKSFKSDYVAKCLDNLIEYVGTLELEADVIKKQNNRLTTTIHTILNK